MAAVNTVRNEYWETICSRSDLVAGSGVCALLHGQQVAIYFLPGTRREIYALSNWDPIGSANVMSRGILGSIGEELVIASPLYKQHFNLETGVCLEQPEHRLRVYAARIVNDAVQIQSAE